MSQRSVTNSVTDNFWRLFQPLNTQSSRRTKFNALKRATLRVFADAGGWLDPPSWARRAGFYPVRAAYTYLARLYRYGLLRRGRDAQLRVVYRLSRRGKQRLAWLQS